MHTPHRQVRCSGDFPCSRCLRLSYPCRPTVLDGAGAQGEEDGGCGPLLDLAFDGAKASAAAAVGCVGEAMAALLQEGRVDRRRAVAMV